MGDSGQPLKIKKSSPDSLPDTKNKILLVDDEAFNLQAMKNILQVAFDRNGHSRHLVEKLVDTALNGKIAVDKVRQLYETKGELYGLVLTDIIMPEKDGFEASAAIRQYMKQV